MNTDELIHATNVDLTGFTILMEQAFYIGSSIRSSIGILLDLGISPSTIRARLHLSNSMYNYIVEGDYDKFITISGYRSNLSSYPSHHCPNIPITGV